MASSGLRHFAVAFTEEELAEIHKGLQKLPTFDGKYVSTKDFQAGILGIAKVDRSNEQIQSYINYFDKKHGGKVTVDDAVDFYRKFHSGKECGRKLAVLVDENKDGLIDAEEFKEIADLISVHLGRRTSVTYDRFLREADKDGTKKVNVDECANWIDQYLANQDE